MRTIIAGSREITNYDCVKAAIECSEFKITTVISGGARGVDTLGVRYAKEHNIPVEMYIPQWRNNGVFDKSAGFKRNLTMAKNADALVAVWDGQSRGTKNMINTAKKLGLKVYVFDIEENAIIV